MPKATSKKSLSAKVKASESKEYPPHLIIIARAGTGKTTTLVEGMKVMRGLTPSITPSEQQEEIWNELKKSSGCYSICFAAFGRAIADELKRRVPPGCEAMTMHQMGSSIVRKAFPFAQLDSEGNKTKLLIEKLHDCDIRQLYKTRFEYVRALDTLVDKCKMNLVDGENATELLELVTHYDIDLGDSESEVFQNVPKILAMAKDVETCRMFDFSDMIWLPVTLKLPAFRFDVLLIDEAQDMNRGVQALALRAGRRLILCGDPEQAIFGFAGADTDSIPRMQKTLEASSVGCVVLPLNVTRRCGLAIVKEAQKIVKDFQAHPNNGPGKVSTDVYKPQVEGQKTYRDRVKDGDMVLCRNNAPLISQCFKFLKEGRKAQVIGREIGQGLINLIFKLMKYRGKLPEFMYHPGVRNKSSIIELTERLADWYETEREKELARKFPRDSKISAMTDRRDCIESFCDSCETVNDVVIKINQVFTDKTRDGIRLSSIHKAKGLEAKTVFFINAEDCPCPAPWAKSAWEKKQERNLLYVATTRAIEELVHVS